MGKPPPPYQLVSGDRYNLTLGCIAAFILAAAKDQTGFHPFIKWSMNAYTNWNLAFIMLRVVASQKQWDPFLLTNSLGVFLGFRTAFCQGLDDNMRKKIKRLGFPMGRKLFMVLDHLCHTAPPAILLAALVHRKQRVSPMNSVYTLIISTWFAFRQSAHLDASDLYVPHPWKRAWLGIVAGVLTTPSLVNALIDGKRRKLLLCIGALLAPYLSARLDPHLRATYNFECRLQEAAKDASDAAERRRGASAVRRGANRSGGPGAPGAEAVRSGRDRSGMLRVQSDAAVVNRQPTSP